MTRQAGLCSSSSKQRYEVAVSLGKHGPEVLTPLDQLISVRAFRDYFEVTIAGVPDHTFDKVLTYALSPETRIDLSVVHRYRAARGDKELDLCDPLPISFDIEFAFLTLFLLPDLHLSSV